MDDVPITDEDRLIYQLTIHRDLVGWVIIKLTQADISSQRTTGNDPKGDILIVNEIIDTGTVIAVVSSAKISQPGKAKFFQAGIAYAENIPLSEFYRC